MMRRIAALFLCLCLILFAGSAFADSISRITDGFEYTVADGHAVISAYHGDYLPRSLPEKLDGYDVFPDYADPVFSHLVHAGDGYSYGLVSADEAWIVGYTGMQGYQRVARIPETVGGIRVTGIADRAFWSCGVIRDPFAEVVIVPGSVRTIGREAFAWTALGYIVLEEGLEEIGDLAFMGLGQAYMRIPASVRKMGINPFSNDIDFGHSVCVVPVLESDAFFGQGDRMIYSREDMRLIAFRNDPFIENAETCYRVPDGIRIIGDYAFYMASGLTEIILPDSVREIGARAFRYCTSLERVTLPDGVVKIGDEAFCNTAVTELEIPSSVTEIGSGIFQWETAGEATIICDPGSAAEAYARTCGYKIRYR